MKNLEQQLSPDNNEDIYLQDLVIETPNQERKSERHFDLERDITEEDWEGAQKALEGYREEKDWNNFIELAAYMAVLDFTKVNLTDNDWEEVKWKMESTPSDEGYYDFSSEAAAVFMIDPEKSDLSEDDLDYIKDEIGDQTYLDPSVAEWGTVITMSGRLAILDLDKVDLTEEDWEWMQTELDSARKPGSGWNTLDFSSLAGYMSILDKSRVEVTEEDWEKMGKDLERARRGKDWANVMELSFFMHILSADKIELTNPGMKLIFNDEEPEQDFNTDLLLPPEKRI